MATTTTTTASPSRPATSFAEAWADAESRLAEHLPGFAPRPQQAECSRLIHTAFATREHAAIDAPVGLGKSLALLVAAEHATGRTVVSTATRALQAQLRDADVPLLQAAGVLTRPVAILEGRGRYLCVRRAEVELRDANPAAIDTLTEILALPDLGDGKRDSLPITVPDWLWDRICSDADACAALNCTMDTVCSYTVARDAARTADIVVVNHHVLLADAAIKGGGGVAWGNRRPEPGEREKPAILGAYRNLLIDEAHALEAAVESFGERRVTVRGIQALATRISRLPDTTAACNLLGECLVEVKSALAVLPQGSLIEAMGEDDPLLEKAAAFAKRAAQAVRDAESDTYENATKVEVLAQACLALSKRLAAIDSALRYGSDDLGPRAPSATDSSVSSQLVDVAPWLREHLFDHVTTVALSGTLTVPGNRDYVPRRVGLDASVVSLPTVFDLRTQRLVFVTPRVEDKAAMSARCTDADVAELRDLVAASRGRALVLFPAMVDLRFVHDRLKGTLDHTLLAQGVTPDPTRRTRTGDVVPASPAALAARFTDDISSVLLATRSFFEGVDFPGETASLVVIMRFPNLRPDDPLTLARRRLIESTGGNPWRDYQEPSMQLLFRQAAGRAIRRVDDRGVVAVLDPRSGSKGYAKTALRALAPSDYTDAIADVEAFLA